MKIPHRRGWNDNFQNVSMSQNRTERPTRVAFLSLYIRTIWDIGQRKIKRKLGDLCLRYEPKNINIRKSKAIMANLWVTTLCFCTCLWVLDIFRSSWTSIQKTIFVVRTVLVLLTAELSCLSGWRCYDVVKVIEWSKGFN